MGYENVLLHNKRFCKHGVKPSREVQFQDNEARNDNGVNHEDEMEQIMKNLTEPENLSHKTNNTESQI